MFRIFNSRQFWIVIVVWVVVPFFYFLWLLGGSSKPQPQEKAIEARTDDQGKAVETRTEEKPKPVWVMVEEGRYTPIVRVFFGRRMNSDTYTVFVQKETKLEKFDIWANEVRLMVDVPDGKPSYVTWKRFRCVNYLEAGKEEFRIQYEELHLQNPKQVRAGVWEEWQRYRAGKYTRSKLVDGPIIELE